MTAPPPAWRQTIASTDAKRAKVKKTKTCLTCPAVITGAKKYCGPCYAARLEQNIARNRHKYRRPRT